MMRVFQTSETQRFLLLSILIGVFAGLLVVCFHVAIEFIGWSTLTLPFGVNPFRTVVSPALGGLLGALIVSHVFRPAKGSGVVETKAALYISDGYVPPQAIAGKFLACAFSIGMGNSLGPEDPSLHMGAGVASLLGRAFRLTRGTMRMIAPVGAAAGIAAAFNTPITAVLFVIEEVVGDWNAGVLGSIVLSSVSAVAVLRWFLGNEPLFLVPEFELSHPWELVVYAVIGVIGGTLSALFVKVIGHVRKRLARLPERTREWLPAVAGLLVGAAGLWVPEVLGAGYGTVDKALHGRFLWNALLILGGAKMLATLACFSAGTPGGMFAPALFTGAMIGGGIGGLSQLFLTFPVSPVGAYVLVGMGTFFAGVFRAPMTSIFMVFEVSASYVIILPVMIANTVAYLFSRKLQAEPFFTMIARQEGLELPSLEQRRETPAITVEEAMSPPPETVLNSTEPIVAALEKVARFGPLLVERSPGLWVWVRSQDLDAALGAGRGSRPLIEALPPHALPVLYPDLSLDSALRRFGSHRVLPVISRRPPYALTGLLSIDDVRRGYGLDAAPPGTPSTGRAKE